MFKRTPLHDEAFNGREPSVKWLVAHGADVNLMDSQGQTALTLGATYKANAAILQLLLDNGATIPPKNVSGMTQGACSSGNLDALVFLEHHGIKMDSNECYAALAFVSSPNPDVLKWVSRQAPIKNIPIRKETMLHVAAEHNNIEIARRLLEADADVNAPGYQGRPPRLRQPYMTIWSALDPPHIKV